MKPFVALDQQGVEAFLPLRLCLERERTALLHVSRGVELQEYDQAITHDASTLVSSTIAQSPTDALTRQFTQSLLLPITKFIAPYDKLALATSTWPDDLFVAWRTRAHVTSTRASVTTRSRFGATLIASRDWRDAVASRVAWQLLERGGAAWAVSDLGWRVRTDERFERMRMASLSHQSTTLSVYPLGNLPPCTGGHRSQRTDHTILRNCTSLSTPPHSRPRPHSVWPKAAPDPCSIRTRPLWYVSRNNTSRSLSPRKVDTDHSGMDCRTDDPCCRTKGRVHNRCRRRVSSRWIDYSTCGI